MAMCRPRPTPRRRKASRATGAVILDEDFIGAGHLAAFPTVATTGYPWVSKIVGAGPPTVGVVANQGGGIVALALAATSEKEDAVLYAGDQLNWDLTEYTSIETRIALSVLPGALVEMVWGFRSAWVDGPDNAAQYLDFQVLGSGLVNCRIKDGVTAAQSFATGVTMTAGAFRNFRIEASDPTNVIFRIDGNPSPPTGSPTKMTFAATGASAILQPYFSVYKASGTGVGMMQVDSIQASMNRA
jgi:hypothetical protein